MINGEIFSQRLKLVNEHVVSDTINYLEVAFSFKTDDWDGLEKWAHFARDSEVYDIRLTDDHIRKEDHLNLSAGKWKVYIHGNEFRGGEVVQRVTTNMVTLYVEPTGALNGEPFPEMPASVTEQILARLENVEQNGGGSGGGISRETDPTVPDWAKQPKKPTYTAEEVGAATEEQFNQLSKEKVDKDQGAKNAGKLLYIGADGIVVPLTLGNGLKIENGVLMLTNATVTEAICGRVVCGEIICGGV